MRPFFLITALLFVAACGGKPPQNQPLEVKVLVLNFNPRLPAQNNQTVQQAYGWTHPRTLAEQYMATVDSVSGGYINYRMVAWENIDAFPAKADGFQYTPETYDECLDRKYICHDPDSLDYPRMLEAYGIVPRINSGEIDELWIFGGPYFGFWESAMAGPGAFYINGGVYEDVAAERPFAIMGFNYEQGLAEMLHNLCHRTEATMTRIYGGWEADQLTTNWARFAANAHQSGGEAAVGSCHFPPNAERENEYDNPRKVVSSAVAWLYYPEPSKRRTPVSRRAWGGRDYHLNYMRWWFSHLPKAPGTNEDGRLNNWWTYVFDYPNYTAEGVRR